MRLRVIISQLIDSDDLLIVRKAHLLENNICDNGHGMGVTMTQEDVIIQGGHQ